MRTTRFWKSLDELPGGETDAREWAARLDEEWPIAAPLLRRTGAFATSIACPSPAGDGCPRRVVRHDDGSIRAVCGETPKFCDDLDLARDDIAILGLDRPKLIKAIAVALSLLERRAAPGAGSVIEIGMHDVHAGRGFPVFLAVPGPWFGDAIEPFAELAAVSGPTVLLTPTRRSLGAAAIRYLDSIGVTRFALADILVADERRRLAAAQPVDVLFAELRAVLADASGSSDPDLVWPLPPDARWEELRLAFISEEVVKVDFRGETRNFDPSMLGMLNRKSLRPNDQWELLKILAGHNGIIPMPPSAKRQTVQKQKQTLSRRLFRAFGIADEPIQAVDGQYRTRFRISAADLNQGKADQRRRNFAGRA